MTTQRKKFRLAAAEHQKQSLLPYEQEILDAINRAVPAIVEELYNRNMRTKTGCHFTKNSLYNILTNEKYRGVY